MPHISKIIIGSAIVLFWGVMTGWLVKANWNDGNAPFSDVSPMLVLRQVLKHEVTSQMGIFKGGRRIGGVTITPIHDPQNAINLDGNISLSQAGAKPQTFNFSIRIALDDTRLHPTDISIRVRRREPVLSVLIELLLVEQKIRYQLASGAWDNGIQEMPLFNKAPLQTAMALAGLPPLPMDLSSMTGSLNVRANRAGITVRGERMDGFRLKLSAAEINLLATLGQLGEVFVVKTSTEYHLLADGLDPEAYLR